MFRRKKIVWLLLLPGLAGLMLFYVVPFFGGIYFSVTDGTYENNFVGLQNYVQVLQNPMFQLGLRNTWELSLLCAPVIWLMAFILSAMLRTLKERSTPFRNILLLPYLMPSSAMLLIWTLMFDYGGVVNRLVVAMGLERVLWLEGDALRFPIVLLYVWKNLGFSVVLFASALSAVHPSLYEYAALEGAGWWTQAFRITLPQILPTAFLVFVLAWVNAFKIFKEVYFIGGSYPTQQIYTLQHFMNNMFAKLDYQKVTTAAYLFAIGVMVLFALMYLSKAVRSPSEA
ncbi:MAG: sugar ABC transporter permease [Eubacteriales bacterium]|nr:sugar ABC transporter permease [Eubacteriales bacterium]